MFRIGQCDYYWDRLIKDSQRLAAFRELFGDEREDYAAALQHYYEIRPAASSLTRFVSAYAGTHPWEDWAETWAHYLHMTDTLETAAACGVSIRLRRAAEPLVRKVPGRLGAPPASFDRLIDCWFPLTGVINNLNRGLGLPDAYPFVLSTLAVQKLRFVHDTVSATGARMRYPESGSGLDGGARQRACA